MSVMLIISTSVCIFAYIVPLIINYILSWFCSETPKERDMRGEILQLEQEISMVSMVNEFAKYSKIHRKLAKLKKDCEDLASEREAYRSKSRIFFTYAAKAFNGLVMLIMLHLYRQEPVIILPKGCLWPLDNLLSWPSVYEDSISLTMWLLITRQAMSNSFGK